MDRWDQWLSRLDRGWLLAASAVLFILFLVVVLPNQAERSQAYAEGVGSPDTSLLTPPAEIYHIAEAYGPEGRRQYIRARWTFDVVFPLAYGLFFFSAINYSARRLWPDTVSVSRLALLAPAAVLADLTENSLMSILMASYPRQIYPLAVAAVGASTVKWVLVYSSMALALLGLAALGVRAASRWFRAQSG